MIKLKLAIKLRQSVGKRFSYVILSGQPGTLGCILEDDPIRGGVSTFKPSDEMTQVGDLNMTLPPSCVCHMNICCSINLFFFSDYGVRNLNYRVKEMTMQLCRNDWEQQNWCTKYI
jgi:hypothetical protein